MYNYQRVDELFRQKKADERDNIDRENQKLKIGKIDMDSIPSSVKFMIFLVILVMLFCGVFYLLKTLEKKPKDKSNLKYPTKNVVRTVTATRPATTNPIINFLLTFFFSWINSSSIIFSLMLSIPLSIIIKKLNLLINQKIS